MYIEFETPKTTVSKVVPIKAEGESADQFSGNVNIKVDAKGIHVPQKLIDADFYHNFRKASFFPEN